MLAILALLMALFAVIAFAITVREYARSRFIQKAEQLAIKDIGAPGVYRTCALVKAQDPLILPSWGSKCIYYLAVIRELVSDDYGAGDGDSRDLARYRVAESRRKSCEFQLTDGEESIKVESAAPSIRFYGEEFKCNSRESEDLAFALTSREYPGCRVNLEMIKDGTRVTTVGRVGNVDGELQFLADGSLLVSTQSLEDLLAEKALTVKFALIAFVICSLLAGVSFLPFLG